MNKGSPQRDGLTARIKSHGILAVVRTDLRGAFLRARWFYLTKIWGMDIHKRALISFKANLDRSFPQGIHVGEGTHVSFGAVILSHDYTKGKYQGHTHIGKYCQIGAHSFIMPGITIGDHSVVGACAVVTKDIPAHCIVVGNPARVVRTGIMTEDWGKIIDLGTRVGSNKVVEKVAEISV